MLTKIRSNHVRKILWGLLFIIIPSFTLWGVNSFIKDRQKSQPIKFGKTTLTEKDLDKYKITASIYYFLILGDDFYREITDDMLKNMAFELYLVLWKAKKEAITISDKEVISTISTMFSTGEEFDKTRYELFTKDKLHLSPHAFEEHLRKILTYEKVLDTYVRNVEIPPETIRKLYIYENQKITLTFLEIPFQKFYEAVEIDEPTKKIYYENHQAQFTTPAQLEVNYIILDNKNETSMITALSKKITSNSAQRLHQLAEELSLTVKSITLNADNITIPGISINPKTKDLMTSLPLHTLSPLINLDEKTLLFEINQRKELIADFEEVKGQITHILKNDKAQALAKEQALSILEKIKTAPDTSFESLAQQFSLELKTQTFSSRNEMKGFFQNAPSDILTALMELKENTLFPRLIITKDTVYITRTESFEPIDETQFLSQQETYRKRILSQRIFLERVKFLSSLRSEISQ